MKKQIRDFFMNQLSDRQYGVLAFLRHHHQLPHLSHPETFSEKILWLKLNYYDASFNKYTDKLQVRSYVQQFLPESYLVPLLGVYPTPEAIPFDTLPSRFVLKTNHASGCNIICKDKTKLDIAAAKNKLAAWLKIDYSIAGREQVYQGIRPCILCEPYLPSPNNKPPCDYKFFCFHGEPQFLQVDYDRFSHHTRVLYDITWQKLPCRFGYPDNPNAADRKPHCFDEMIQIARQLSQPFPFVRVDFYEVEQQVLFGELTFVPENCRLRISPKAWDKRLGAYLRLERVDQSAPN